MFLPGTREFLRCMHLFLRRARQFWYAEKPDQPGRGSTLSGFETRIGPVTTKGDDVLNVPGTSART